MLIYVVNAINPTSVRAASRHLRYKTDVCGQRITPRPAPDVRERSFNRSAHGREP